MFNRSCSSWFPSFTLDLMFPLLTVGATSSRPSHQVTWSACRAKGSTAIALDRADERGSWAAAKTLTTSVETMDYCDFCSIKTMDLKHPIWGFPGVGLIGLAELHQPQVIFFGRGSPCKPWLGLADRNPQNVPRKGTNIVDRYIFSISIYLGKL